MSAQKIAVKFEMEQSGTIPLERRFILNLNLDVPKSKARQTRFLLPKNPGKENVWQKQGWLFQAFFVALALFLIFPAGVSAAIEEEATRGVEIVEQAFVAGFPDKTKTTVGLDLVAAVVEQAADPADEMKAVLTYEKAVEMALKSSVALKNARECVLQAEEMREQFANLRLISGFTPVGPGYDQADAAARELLLGFTQADTGLQMAGKQVEILEGVVAFQVRSVYDEVLQKTAGLVKADRALAFALNKLIQTETKTRLGVESRLNREMARSSYVAEKEQKEHLARQLDEAYNSLNKLLGLEPEARPKLQEAADPPAWLENTSLERHLAPILHDHPYIWLQEQKVAQTERELSLYTYNVGAPSYKVIDSTVQQEKNNLKNLKEEVRKGVRSFYYQLQALESQYKALAANLAQAENGLRVLQLRHKLGMAVPLEIEQAELSILELQSGMQDLARAYGQLKMLFEKPWLMPVTTDS